MFIHSKDTNDVFNIEKDFLFKEEMNGVLCYIKDIEIDICISGTFTIRKRKIISLDNNKSIYKITIENLREDINHIGVHWENQNKIKIYEAIRSHGVLFSKLHKKIFVNKRKNKIEFTVSPTGKIL